MSDTTAIIGLCGALVPVLGAAGSAIRYLIRILREVEHVTSIAESAATQLQDHIQASNAETQQLKDTVHAHDVQLAVLHAATGTTPTGITP